MSAITSFTLRNEPEFSQSKDVENIELLRLYREENDEIALDSLIRRFIPLARYLANKYYYPGGDSDDLMQEALVGLCNAIRDYNSNGGVVFRAFACLCIERNLITAIKKANRQKHFILNNAEHLNKVAYREKPKGCGGLERQDFLTDSENTPEKTFLQKETLLQLRSCLDSSLSKLERQVMAYYMEGYTYQEISACCGIPFKAIDNAMQRTRKKLRQVDLKIS